MPHKFKLGNQNVEVTNDVCSAKGEGAVHHSRITRLLKRFYAFNFKLGFHNVEVAKDICFAKGEGAVDHSTITT